MTPKQHSFLAAYAELGIIADAAKAAGVPRRSHYDWLAASDEYKHAFADAEEDAIERMESECRRRAVEGSREPVIYQGRVCFDVQRDERGNVIYDAEGKPALSNVPLTVPRKSDNLLMFVLKSKRPDKYRDNATVEHTGTGGGPVSLEVVFVNPNRKEAA